MNGVGYGITPFMGASGILARSSGGGGAPFTNTYSMSFDGVDECFNVGATPLNLRFNRLDTFSFSAWVKVDTSKGNIILCNQLAPSTNYRGYYFAIQSNNQVRVILRSTLLDSLVYTSTTTISNGVWNHIVFTYDGTATTTGGNIYINNNLDTLTRTGTLTGTMESTDSLYIGSRNNADNFFDGKLDEIAIFNTELSASDVSAIFNNGVPTSLSSYPSLVSWWRMGDGDTWGNSSWTLTDNGSGGNDATSVNMEEADRLPISPNSYTQNSFSFDGVDEYLTMGNVLNTSDTGASAISISCWYKTNNSGSQMFVSKQNNSGGFNGFSLSMQPNNKLSFFIGTISGSQYLYVQSANISTHSNGNWHHLAVTYDGSRSTTGINMYFDGSPLSITSVNNVPPVSVQNSVEFLLGARGLTYSNKLNGSLDEVSYFNTELSASDVSTIFNNGIPQDISSLSPLSHWRMGESATWNGSIWTLTDQGSGGNNATSVNMEEADKTGDQAYVL